MQGNPYDNYKQQSVMTMTAGEMLVKLYDEVLRQTNSACRSIDEKDYTACNLSLQKCQRILNYLDNTLDKKYPVSAQLSSLYDFFIRQIVAANIHKDTKPLQEVMPLVNELRDTFVQAEKLSRMAAQHRPLSAHSSAISAVG